MKLTAQEIAEALGAKRKGNGEWLGCCVARYLCCANT